MKSPTSKTVTIRKNRCHKNHFSGFINFAVEHTENNNPPWYHIVHDEFLRAISSQCDTSFKIAIIQCYIHS